MPKKSFQGHLLVANPNNPRDELSRAVVLLVTHTNDKCVGIQINNPVTDPDLQTISANIGIDFTGSDPLWYGGSVGTNKIHVVHSTDWSGLSTIKINDEISVTNDISVLAALSRGEGPNLFRACAGYWVWEDGELDHQLDPKNTDRTTHKWETVEATVDNVFDGEGPEQWRKVIEESARQQVSSWF
jgi:putative transcriptional regulator